MKRTALVICTKCGAEFKRESFATPDQQLRQHKMLVHELGPAKPKAEK